MKTQQNQIEIGIRAYWITQNDGNLRQLYKIFVKDTKDKKVKYIEFCDYMYDQCKKPIAWLIEAENFVKQKLEQKRINNINKHF